jgi:transcriptional regulator with XRE-family HTH domain
MRELAGVTARRAAKAARASHGHIGNIESGKAVPTEKQLTRLLQFYTAGVRARMERLAKLVESIRASG